MEDFDSKIRAARKMVALISDLENDTERASTLDVLLASIRRSWDEIVDNLVSWQDGDTSPAKAKANIDGEVENIHATLKKIYPIGDVVSESLKKLNEVERMTSKFSEGATEGVSAGVKPKKLTKRQMKELMEASPKPEKEAIKILDEGIRICKMGLANNSSMSPRWVWELLEKIKNSLPQ